MFRQFRQDRAALRLAQLVEEIETILESDPTEDALRRAAEEARATLSEAGRKAA